MKYLVTLVLLLLSFNTYGETFNPSQCEVYFSPKGGITDRLVQYIDSSKKSIRVLAYGFTSQPIGDALIRAKQRGVDVQIVVDKSNLTTKSSLDNQMLSAGIPLYVDSKHQIMHNKVILVDGEWFETGSFNYSANAENSNGENALLCKSKEGYNRYISNWNTHKAHSQKQ